MLASATAQALPAPWSHTTLSGGRWATVPSRRLPLAAARCSAIGGDKGPGSAFEIAAPTPTQLLARTAAAVAASGLLLFSAVPASLADITTVTPQEATQMAKPLKRQEVKKGRIWTLFVLGATALFGSTVVLENNEKWFPAISRANRAMKSARDQMAAREAAAAAEQAAFEQRLAAVQAERRADAVVDNAVLEGLQEARQRSALAAAPAAAAPAAPSLPAAATEVEPELEEEEEVEVQAAPGSSSGSGMAEAGAADGSGSSGSAAAWEVRKPLFEISAEQIEASSRLQELQQELERRKAEAAAAGAGAGAAAAPAGSSAQQEP